jgi:hypothetical protein
MSKSDYLENKILDLILGNTAFSLAGPLYIGLYTAPPTDAGGGTEVSGGSYARVSVTQNTTNWPNASGGSKSNGAAVTFPTATASWGTVSHFGIFDASTAGNLLRWGALSASKTIGSGDTASFAAGALTVTED